MKEFKIQFCTAIHTTEQLAGQQTKLFFSRLQSIIISSGQQQRIKHCRDCFFFSALVGSLIIIKTSEVRRARNRRVMSLKSIAIQRDEKASKNHFSCLFNFVSNFGTTNFPSFYFAIFTLVLYDFLFSSLIVLFIFSSCISRVIIFCTVHTRNIFSFFPHHQENNIFSHVLRNKNEKSPKKKIFHNSKLSSKEKYLIL